MFLILERKIIFNFLFIVVVLLYKSLPSNYYIMFFLKLFCDTQEMHKLLIRESYIDCKYLISKYKRDHPSFTVPIYVHDFNGLSKEEREELIEYKIKLENLRNVLINNLLCYCVSYPNEKISQNRFIKEYKEYSYRLEQNIDEVLEDL